MKKNQKHLLYHSVILQASLFKTKLGWFVLAGYQKQQDVSSGKENCVVMRLLIGAQTKKEAITFWDKELTNGFLSRAVPFLCNFPFQFTDWYPQCREMLIQYGQGDPIDFTSVQCDLNLLTPFQQEVLNNTRQISAGELLTYGELAEKVGRPKAARAVGGAMSKNTIPVIIPCHRVVGTQGKLTGFTAPGGLKTKQSLLDIG